MNIPFKSVIGIVALSFTNFVLFAQDKAVPKTNLIAEVNTETSQGTTVPNGSDIINTKEGSTQKSSIQQKILLQSPNKLTDRNRKMSGDQYVPIAGEIEYFGKNNDMVLNYTKKYYERNFKHFSTIRTRGNKYFKIIDKTFERRDVPLEIKYLSVIESALTNTALSPVGALGPWQFMPATGQFMGLVVNSKVDERRDWHKSTNAAAKYVNYLYDIFGDWLLVVASYNSGPRPVLNAMKKTGSSDFFVLKKYLPAETQNHVMAFIATATVMERMDSYIGAPVPSSFDWKWLNVKSSNGAFGNATESAKPKNPFLLRFSEEELKEMAILKIKKPLDLEVLAHILEEDRRRIGKMNFNYFNDLEAFNNGEITDIKLVIPKNKVEIFLQKQKQIYSQTENLLE
ncbi:MAG TPA: lytic transglycosylase domain-containing protein [Edaphocola sp.]|nr:lytic transglycosylase domain-containing protein [Edaphocola sp.]